MKKTPPNRLSKEGRPRDKPRPDRKRNPERTREAILTASEKMFINKGFDGATLGGIAKAAGVHQSLIHHYFGSKLDLYLEVMRRYLVNFGAALREHLPAPRENPASVADGVRAYFRFLEQNPDSVRMGCWFNLFFQKNPVSIRDQSVGSPEEDQAQGFIYDIIDRLSSSLAGMQRDGLLRRDIDPVLVLTLVFCLVEHWHEARNRLLRRLHPDKRALVGDAAYLDAALKVLLEGILPR
ncbi:MAG: TetR/AcrR family transcriptional regulator [Pseudomonadota bacterium]